MCVGTDESKLQRDRAIYLVVYSDVLQSCGGYTETARQSFFFIPIRSAIFSLLTHKLLCKVPPDA